MFGTCGTFCYPGASWRLFLSLDPIFHCAGFGACEKGDWVYTPRGPIGAFSDVGVCSTDGRAPSTDAGGKICEAYFDSKTVETDLSTDVGVRSTDVAKVLDESGRGECRGDPMRETQNPLPVHIPSVVSESSPKVDAARVLEESGRGECRRGPERETENPLPVHIPSAASESSPRRVVHQDSFQMMWEVRFWRKILSVILLIPVSYTTQSHRIIVNFHAGMG